MQFATGALINQNVGYQGLLNSTNGYFNYIAAGIVVFNNIILAGVPANNVLTTDASQQIAGIGLGSQNIVMGNNLNIPVATLIVAGTNITTSLSGTNFTIGVVSHPTFGNITDAGLSPNAMVYSDSSSILSSLVLTDLQVPVGVTSSAPVAKTLTGSSDITVTNNSGTVVFDTIQGITTTSSPSFASINLTNNSNQIVLGTTNTATITSTQTSTRTYTIPDQGSNANFMMSSGASQNISSHFNYNDLGVAYHAGALMSLTATNGLSSVELDLNQIAVGTGTNSTITARNVVAGNSITITNSTPNLTWDTIQDIRTSASPTFNDLTLSALHTSSPVKTDGLNKLVSGNIILTSDVTGILPIANGGTNSASALANGKLMVSSGGAIIEGTSSTSPSFSSITLTNNTNEIVLGTTNTNTITNPSLGASFTQTLPGTTGTIANTTNTITLANKLLDSTCVLCDSSDNTKTVSWSASGITTGNKKTLSFSGGNATYTVPSATDTFVMLTANQAITTKTITLTNAVSGYSASVLDYFEDGTTATLTLGNAIGNVNFTGTFTRIGNSFVTFSFPNSQNHLAGSTTFLTITGIPARFTPVTQKNNMVSTVQSNSAVFNAGIFQWNSGITAINVFADINFSNFTSGNSIGINSGCITYSIL